MIENKNDNNLIKLNKLQKCEIRFALKSESVQLEKLSKQFANENCCNGIIADNQDYFSDKNVAVCVVNNQIVAYAYGELETEIKPKSYASVGDKYFYLDEIFVDPKFRSLGYGKKLYAFLEDYAKQNGAKTIRTNAVSKNYVKLLNFYINELGMDFWSAFLVKKIEGWIMLIFVTGKSGVGKSYFASMLADKLNLKYVNVDVVSKSIYNNMQVVEGVKKIFDESVVDNTGKVNTKQIGKIIFDKNNFELKQRFYDFTWNYVKPLILEELKGDAVLEWSMLPLTDLWQMPAIKVLITANENMRLNKLIERDNVSVEYLKLRDLSAPDFSNLKFDFVFDNDYTMQFAETSIKQIVENLK